MVDRSSVSRKAAKAMIDLYWCFFCSPNDRFRPPEMTQYQAILSLLSVKEEKSCILFFLRWKISSSSGVLLCCYFPHLFFPSASCLAAARSLFSYLASIFSPLASSSFMHVESCSLYCVRACMQDAVKRGRRKATSRLRPSRSDGRTDQRQAGGHKW